MSAISHLSAAFSPYQLSGSRPAAATSEASTGPAATHDQDRDERPRSRESSLVNAMMAAFQALELGSATAASAPTPGTATPALAASTTEVVPAATSTTSTTATTAATDPAAASETLEKSVREFAHALFNALHDTARSQTGHRQGHEHYSEHVSERGSRRSSGYDSFVQRLEVLAQSLGAAASTPAGDSAPGANTTAAATPATVPVTTTSPAASTSPVANATVVTAPAPAHGSSRLLSAFTKLFDLLQPQSSGTPTGTSGSTMADKLKLFLHTLAQALQAAPASPPPSSTGSLLNVSA